MGQIKSIMRNSLLKPSPVFGGGAAHSYELNRHGRKRNWRGPPPKRPRRILKLVPVWLQARMDFISITLSDLQI